MKRFTLGLIFILISSLAGADTAVYFSPNGRCTEAIIGEIKEARSTIDIMMYSLSSRPIARELISANERGVKVRILLDKGQRTQKYTSSRYLIKKGVPVRYHTGSGLMHNKVGIIDGRVLITGSFNWTAQAEKRNAENLLIIKDLELIKKYRERFQDLWEKGKEGVGEEEE